jgi:hypothetical protein
MNPTPIPPSSISWPQAVVWIAVLVLQAWQIYLNHKGNTQAVKNGEVLNDVMVHTNSMKDALVAAADKAGFARSELQISEANRAIQAGGASSINPFDAKMGTLVAPPATEPPKA